MTKNSLYQTLGVTLSLGLIISGAVDRIHMYKVVSYNKIAKVEHIRNHEASKSRGGFLTTHHGIISFTAEPKRITSGYKNFTDDVYKRYQDQQPVIVYYNPDDPDDFFLDDETIDWLAKIVLGLFFGLIVFFYFKPRDGTTKE